MATPGQQSDLLPNNTRKVKLGYRLILSGDHDPVFMIGFVIMSRHHSAKAGAE